jgi:hypothetical protein
MIYFMQDTLTKAIKIGYSKNPKKRRSGLQTATPNQLVLLGEIHGGLEHETAYHERFADFRIHGEWFKGDILPDVLEIIAKNPTDRPPPSNVIVTGDSDFRDTGLVSRSLAELHASNRIAWVITGGDRSFANAAEEWARRHDVEIYRYYPKWSRHGRFAGFKIGQQMLRSMFDAKLLLAFLAEKPSQSTTALMGRAEKAGIEVVIRGGPQARPAPPAEVMAQVVAEVARAARARPAAEEDVPWTRPRALAAVHDLDDEDDLPPWARSLRR